MNYVIRDTIKKEKVIYGHVMIERMISTTKGCWLVWDMGQDGMRAGKICMFQLRLSLTAADQDALIQVKVTKEYLWWSLKFFCIGLDCTETKGSLGWLLQCPPCLCFFFLFRWSLQVLVLCLDKYRVFWKLDYAKENGCSFKPFLPRKSKCYIVIVCVLPVCLCVWWWCFFP